MQSASVPVPEPTTSAAAGTGRANAAAVDLLAAAFGLRKAQVTIVSGTRGRDKTVDLDSDDPALAERLDELLHG